MTATQVQEPDEDDVRDFIQEYGDAKRLAPSRANDILEAALGTEQPPPPDADACCGSSCCPCVQDLWREEVAVWKAVREGTPSAEELAEKRFGKK